MINWKKDLNESITKLTELREILKLPHSAGVESDYPLFVPRPFVDLMEKGNPNDPLLLQVLPCQAETIEVAGFSRDPLDEFSNHIETSLPCSQYLLKKYAGRVLILVSESCGIHCRFCFRRFFPRSNKQHDLNKILTLILDKIRNDNTIEEVILSGGDPLILDDSGLKQLFDSLTEIPTIRRIRIHSRLPVILPSRITPDLVEILSSQTIPIYLVFHINHPNELSEEFLTRNKLLSSNIILSQTVFLKGINDNVDVLTQLFERLVNHRILPYYLHQLDRVRGAAHFEVSPETGIKLMEQLRNRLSGYAVPKYVREVPGEMSKFPL